MSTFNILYEINFHGGAVPEHQGWLHLSIFYWNHLYRVSRSYRGSVAYLDNFQYSFEIIYEYVLDQTGLPQVLSIFLWNHHRVKVVNIPLYETELSIFLWNHLRTHVFAMCLKWVIFQYSYSFEIIDFLWNHRPRWWQTKNKPKPNHFQYSFEIILRLKQRLRTRGYNTHPFNIPLKSSYGVENIINVYDWIRLSIFLWNHLQTLSTLGMRLMRLWLSIFLWNHRIIRGFEAPAEGASRTFNIPLKSSQVSRWRNRQPR